jgi:hypothetical protein
MTSRQEIHVLSLGAGVQSTTVYLLALEGRIHLDAAIFADTQDEPESVYRHLSWLMSRGGHRVPILIRTVGRLGDDIIHGRDSNGGKFYAAAIPAYSTPYATGTATGKGHRQCTREYKIRVIEQAIRRDVLGLRPRQRVPRDVRVHQYIGISLDEARRAVSIRKRFGTGERRGFPEFPLLDLGWTRGDCERFNAERVPHPVTRSACVFCPLKNDAEWLRLKEGDAAGWARAVAVDEALRQGRPAMHRQSGRQTLYLHASARPLVQVAFKDRRLQGEFPGFSRECEGVCGV